VLSKGLVFDSVMIAVMYSQAMSVQFITHQAPLFRRRLLVSAKWSLEGLVTAVLIPGISLRGEWEDTYHD